MTKDTPTPAPAPMTLPERLRAIRFSSNPDDYDAITIEAAAEIDVLTARVAHWQSVHQTAAEANERLRAELAAARKELKATGDRELTIEAIQWKSRALAAEAALKEAETRSLDNAVRAHGWMVQHDTLLGFIQVRQSVLNELIDNDPRPASPKPSDVPDIIARAQAAEAKLETIRRALFPDPEHHITHHARYNLEGALADLEAGQNDPTVRRTLKRVAGQIAAAERALQTKDTTP